MEEEHRTAVAAWLERIPARSVETLIQAFEDTFAALWQRSLLTLGEVTLTAILDRVLHRAAELYPSTSDFEVEASRLRYRGLRSHAGMRHEQVTQVLRFVVEEFLTVLGNLTAQILTPALHAELSKGHSTARDTDRSEEQVS